MTDQVSLQPYCYHAFLSFHLADAAGILFFGHAFTLAHQAYEHFVMEKLDYSWKEWFENPDWIVPIKHAEADYFCPLRAGEECQIELQVTAMSTSSFTLTATLKQQLPCCLVKTVHVFCNRPSLKKIPIPGDIQTRLAL